jgi:hypothetical protein
LHGGCEAKRGALAVVSAHYNREIVHTFPSEGNQDYQPTLIYPEVDNLDYVGENPGQTVLFQNAKDGYGNTLKPRLISASADLSKVWFIDETTNEFLSFTDNRLEEAM